MPIPRGTRQLVTLREVAKRLGATPKAVKHWWWKNKLLGRLSEVGGRKRVTVPIEVLEFHLRHHRFPTKLEMYEAGDLSGEYLLDLSGPDGGLRERLREASLAPPSAASESGTLAVAGVML